MISNLFTDGTLSSIFHAGSFSITTVALALGSAIVMGVLIALLFKLLCAESGSFTLTLAVMPLLVTIVIMIVNGNIGTSVAVLGAFGLVRFRSAPGSGREIMFVFFSMAVGLAIGMGFLTLAFIAAAVVALMLVIITVTGLGRTASREKELKITIPEDLSYHGIFDDLFRTYTTKSVLQRVKTTNMGTMYELSYRVMLRSPEKEKEFIDALRCRNGNLTVNLGLVQREKNEL